jgi:hypothetical protein
MTMPPIRMAARTVNGRQRLRQGGACGRGTSSSRDGSLGGPRHQARCARADGARRKGL